MKIVVFISIFELFFRFYSGARCKVSMRYFLFDKDTLLNEL